MAKAERVIVTGSNIPTAEEVGPVPVDTYRPEDIHKLGARTATDLTQRLPAITGGAFNENITGSLDGRTEINLRGLLPKETLVLVDGKRVAPVGGVLQGVSVDLNLIPWPVVDHIDILKDGASAIYGSDAIAGVFNIILKHKFRGLEIEGSVGNTNLGSSNDAAEREGYLLAGAGDDKTDIVVFAQYYDRAAIFSRDRDLSSNGDFSKFGGIPNPVPPVPGVSFLPCAPAYRPQRRIRRRMRPHHRNMCPHPRCQEKIAHLMARHLEQRFRRPIASISTDRSRAISAKNTSQFSAISKLLVLFMSRSWSRWRSFLIHLLAQTGLHR
jgi:outer membrane receptor protein involved in Fe transport